MRRRLIWWGSVTGGLAALLLLGRGRLALPWPWDASAFTARLRSDGATVAGVALMRLAVFAAGCYLAALGALMEATRLPGGQRWLRHALRVPWPGRRVIWRLLGVPGIIVAGAGLWGAGVAAARPVSAPPALLWVGPAQAPPGDAPVLSLLSPLPPAPTSTPAAARRPTPPASSPAPPSSVPPSSAPPSIPPDGTPPQPEASTHAPTDPDSAHQPATYVLVPGDHFWAVAERTLTAAWGRIPDERHVGGYWWRLVEANRSRLVDPANPDFVLPGMTVVLPAPDRPP